MKNWIVIFGRTFGGIAVIAIGVVAYFYFLNLSRFSIASDSMAPTLRVGDVIEADRSAYDGREVERGDIVLFRVPNEADAGVMVGRVVGLPGDRVSFNEQKLNLNGNFVHSNSRMAEEEGFEEVTETLGDRSYSVWYVKGSEAFENEVKPVEPEHYFIAGDNRDNSRDSRVIGPISRNLLVGKAKKIVDSKRGSRIGKSL